MNPLFPCSILLIWNLCYRNYCIDFNNKLTLLLITMFYNSFEVYYVSLYSAYKKVMVQWSWMSGWHMFWVSHWKVLTSSQKRKKQIVETKESKEMIKPRVTFWCLPNVRIDLGTIWVFGCSQKVKVFLDLAQDQHFLYSFVGGWYSKLLPSKTNRRTRTEATSILKIWH